MTPKKVTVVWEDCLELDIDDLWVEKVQDFKWEPYLVETIGFLLYDGPEGVVVTDTWTAKDHTGTRTQIPRGMIRSVVEHPTPTRKTRRAKATVPG